MIGNATRDKDLAVKLRQNLLALTAMKNAVEAEARNHYAENDEDIGPIEGAYYDARDQLDEAIDLVDRVIQTLADDAAHPRG